MFQLAEEKNGYTWSFSSADIPSASGCLICPDFIRTAQLVQQPVTKISFQLLSRPQGIIKEEMLPKQKVFIVKQYIKANGMARSFLIYSYYKYLTNRKSPKWFQHGSDYMFQKRNQHGWTMTSKAHNEKNHLTFFWQSTVKWWMQVCNQP